MPKQKHWVIIKFGSVHIEGDERSRTNPGHGYPAYDQPTVEYLAYATEAEWKQAINILESKGESYSYSAIVVNPVEVILGTKVRIR